MILLSPLALIRKVYYGILLEQKVNCVICRTQGYLFKNLHC